MKGTDTLAATFVRTATCGHATKCWTQSVRIDGRPTSIGLGRYPTVTLVLVHVNGDCIEAAYRRSVLFERRRTLMQQWADYLTARAGMRAKP